MPKHLLPEALYAFDNAPRGVIVLPSIPILYFGDCDAFFRSPVRVITVAKNPSVEEFPRGNPFMRFPSVIGRNTALDNARNFQHYRSALNNYFSNQCCPYWQWFGGIDHILHGFGVSFRSDRLGVALHTDLLSPVATDPTWSHLQAAERKTMQNIGIHIWQNLIEWLRPHVILISLPKHHLGKLPLQLASKWSTVHSITRTLTGSRKRPYEFLHAFAYLKSGHEVDLVFGRASQTPFGSVSSTDKQQLGLLLKGKLRNW